MRPSPIQYALPVRLADLATADLRLSYSALPVGMHLDSSDLAIQG
jgi:hypothetical protein